MLFGQHQAKLSLHSISCLNVSQRKPRYRYFPKIGSAMRILFLSKSCNNVPMCANRFTEFCCDCVSLYSKGFVSYNIHSLIHLGGKFSIIWIFEFCFMLWLLKAISRSLIVHSIVVIILCKTLHYSIHSNQEFFCFIYISVNLPGFQAKELHHYRKVKLSTGCNTLSIANSPVQFRGSIANVVDIVKYASSDEHFIVRKYQNVDNFFPVQFFPLNLFFLFVW